MSSQRIICLIDMDCFYVQCEQRLQPDKWGKPCGVAQYNQWRGGGLIAVNYEARPFGIKRGMRCDDCVKLCSEFHTFQVPERNGKAELTRYRECSAEVFDCIAEYIKELETEIGKNDLILFEKASVDEAYIDFTKFIDEKRVELPDLEELKSFNCKVKAEQETLEDWYGWMMENFDEDIYRLVMGAFYVGTMRKRIHGISVNKMLAKLACSVNKPNAQTVLPFSSVSLFFDSVKISDVRNLGGKAGDHVKEVFHVHTMGELAQLELPTLRAIYDEKQAHWLFMMAKGIDDEPVTARRLSKSIGCGKQFPGPMALSDINKLIEWLNILCEELYERLESDRKSNNRIAKLLTVTYVTAKKGHASKALKIRLDSNQQYLTANRLSMHIFRQVFEDMKKTQKIEPIHNLMLAASKFAEINSQTNTINKFFTKLDGPPMRKEKGETVNYNNDNNNGNNSNETNVNGQPEKNAEPQYMKEFETLHKSSFFFRKIQQLYDERKFPFVDEKTHL